MRFTRRNKGPLAWARRARSKTEEPAFAPVASEERAALVGREGAAVENAPGKDGAGPARNDPSQQLLTVLGRFHRQVAKARMGAAQALWSDECMSELIQGAEIAARENWKDVLEVLTETARVLQTYEYATRAAESVPFLLEIYEILSLMVADLMAGEPRTWVMKRWRDRYRKALDELNNAGLTLVRDDDEDSRAFESAPVEEAAAPTRDAYAAPADATTDDDVPFDVPSLDDVETGPAPLDDDEVPSLDELAPLDVGPIADKEPVDRSLLEDEPPAARDEGVQPAERMALAGDTEQEPEVVAMLDSLCEGLSRIESGEGDAQRGSVYAALEEGLAFLEQWARRLEQPEAVEVCRTMSLLCQAAQGVDALDEKYFELGYGFCGVYMDARQGPGNLAVSDWLAEAGALMARWADHAAAAPAEIEESHDDPPETAEESPAEPPPAVESAPEIIDTVDDSPETAEAPCEEPPTMETAPAPAAEAPPEEPTPEWFLRIAQRAVEEGQATDAKLLAMQAAACIARAEATQAQARVRDAETRLQESAAEIERAREELKAVEQGVKDIEAAVAAAETAVTERAGRTQSAAERVSDAERCVEELDARIRELQALRDQEEARRVEAQAALEAERAGEIQAQADVESRRNDEQAARDRLEEARQRMKTLERKRGDYEGLLVKTRDALTRQRGSLEDIEQTIEQMRKAQSGDTEQDGALLF